MGLLDFLFKPTSRDEPEWEPPRTAYPRISASAFPGRMRAVQTVGEHYRQGNIAKLAGPKTAGGVDVRLACELLPDPKNPHDGNAVAVMVSGIHVAYLSREQAVAFHLAMGSRGYAAHILDGFEARIHAGFLDDAGYEASYQVTLYIPKSLAEDIGYGYS